MSQRKTFIIAEAGVNHNGSVEIAKRLIGEASKSGSDAVKFQIFRADAITTKINERAEYQKKRDPADTTQYALLKGLELSKDDFLSLARYAKDIGILFLSSPFDETSADVLESIGVPMYKIGSGEITNLPFLRHVAAKGKPIILSTGMSTLGEIEEALDTIYSTGNSSVSLLHCVTEYPAPYNEINLDAIETLRYAFGLRVGYSDHTMGTEIAMAAVAIGAEIIEKHFTLDRTMVGPDHGSSLEPQEFKAMTEAIRHVESAMGDGFKRPTPSELKNKSLVRKSLVAARYIQIGEILTHDDLVIKRPGTGIQPRDLEKIIGLRVESDIQADEVITWNKLKQR
jgi:N,N'-diacetyllegionaminate synthase